VSHDERPHRSPHAFDLEDVVLVRGGARILDGVTAALPRAAATAVVGPSGSGKSTLLRLLNRFEDPDSGRVLLDGVDARELDVLALRRRVGLLAQRPVMLTGTVAAEVRVGAPALDDDAVAGLLARVALEDIDPARPTQGLSGGEQQRLALARALALDPEVLLLDEPTSALDAEAAGAVDEVVVALVEAGLTAVVVSHDLDRLLAVTTHAVVLDAGRVVEQGPPASVHYLSG
jgi:putative ABC transport system ATP-binding protein